MMDNATKIQRQQAWLERWTMIAWKRPFTFKSVICAVCGQPCSQFCRCMSCRQFAHVGCMENGSCVAGCSIVEETNDTRTK